MFLANRRETEVKQNPGVQSALDSLRWAVEQVIEAKVEAAIEEYREDHPGCSREDIEAWIDNGEDYFDYTLSRSIEEDVSYDLDSMLREDIFNELEYMAAEAIDRYMEDIDA